MEVENYISMLERYRNIVRERNGLVRGIERLKEIIAEDKTQEIETTITNGWRAYYSEKYTEYGDQKINVNSKNLLKFYESELVLIENKLNVIRKRINRERLSSW